MEGELADGRTRSAASCAKSGTGETAELPPQMRDQRDSTPSSCASLHSTLPRRRLPGSSHNADLARDMTHRGPRAYRPRLHANSSALTPMRSLCVINAPLVMMPTRNAAAASAARGAKAHPGPSGIHPRRRSGFRRTRGRWRLARADAVGLAERNRHSGGVCGGRLRPSEEAAADAERRVGRVNRTTH